MSQPWLQLVLAGILEIIWAMTMKSSQGFTKLWPSLITLCAMCFSFWLLAQATRTLPISLAYAVWVAIGATGAAIIGMLMLGEPASVGRILCLALIVGGVIGLKLQS
ncbi:MAG: multidrug efflux SMR transporter [Rickettsiales bacterium]|nr:multidrug efflux SMR transporter [Rickettsiales bacterium]